MPPTLVKEVTKEPGLRWMRWKVMFRMRLVVRWMRGMRWMTAYMALPVTRAPAAVWYMGRGE